MYYQIKITPDVDGLIKIADGKDFDRQTEKSIHHFQNAAGSLT